MTASAHAQAAPRVHISSRPLAQIPRATARRETWHQREWCAAFRRRRL